MSLERILDYTRLRSEPWVGSDGRMISGALNEARPFATFDAPRDLREHKLLIALLDGPCCFYCGRMAEALQLEHVVPRSAGGLALLANEVLACPDCNKAKGIGLPIIARDLLAWLTDMERLARDRNARVYRARLVQAEDRVAHWQSRADDARSRLALLEVVS